MRIFAIAAACLLVATPAWAQSKSETKPESTSESLTDKAKSVGESTGVNSLIGLAPTTQDFVTQVAISDLFELESSKLAAERGDDKTKAFAQKMTTDHTQSSEELKSMVTGGKVKADVPTALDSTHQSKLDKLKDLKGEDFTKQFHSDQVSAHKTAVDLFKRYGEGGENAELKAWAAKTRPHLEEHLKLAEDLKK